MPCTLLEQENSAEVYAFVFAPDPTRFFRISVALLSFPYISEILLTPRRLTSAPAKKLLRRRAELGAFVSMEQIADLKIFSSKAIAGLQKSFKIGDNPQVERINVNTASLERLLRLPYINYDIANAIIARRTTKGKFRNFDELTKINDIFILKSKIISLYLEY